ncbi:MAG: alkylated DNA repair dioxygenase AlkB [Myxococcota bacterium]|jgi:alkylated DNA repair dioxygenase AlkB
MYSYESDFVSAADALFERVRDEVPWTDQMASRRTASVGVPYIYRGATYPVRDWLPVLEDLRCAVANAVGFVPTNCLMNYYPTGRHSLGWHQDDIDILRPKTGIAIVSLGAARPLRLRRHIPEGYHYETLELEPGSLLYMTQEMQSVWQHSLRRSEGAGARISLTFRNIVASPDST